MKRNIQYLLSLSILLCCSLGLKAQISFTSGLIYTQNFNTYSGSLASLPLGWTTGGSFIFRGQGNGSSNTGGGWAYGTGTDWALGYLGSGSSPSINYNVSFVNNTGSTITTLTISYDYEQWRFVAGNFNGWTVTGTGGLASANLSGLNTNSTASGTIGIPAITPKAITLTGLSIAPNVTFGIRWACADGSGVDNGNAIDNFQMVRPCVPSTPVLIDTMLCAGASYTWNGNTYTTPQNITDTFANSGGCDSIVTLDLGFYPQITHSFADTMCSGATYTWGTQSLTATGTFTQVFTSAAGCDSTVTLNLFERNAITHSFADTMCSGATYTWGTQSLTATGTFTQVFTSAAGCDSTVTLNLFERNAITHSFADTICFGETYLWGSQSLTSTGAFTQLFTAAVGCDSTVTLNLFERPEITHSFADTICSGASYIWGAQTLTATGIYTQVFAAGVGCDSTVTLNLFERNAITHSFADTICSGASYTWGTQTLTATGTYTQVFTAAVGCDSTVTLNLFERNAITHSFADTICSGASYTWGTQTLTATGAYAQVFTAAVGCDSTVTLNLFERNAITHSFADTICSGATYTWGTQSLTATGTYTQVFTAAVGCDSTVTLNLFERNAITHSFADTICSGASFSWGTQTLTATGTYTQVFTAAVGCDSTVTLNLFERNAITHNFADTICFGETYTWGTQSLTATGTYTQVFSAAVGCDSTVTLNLFERNNITHSFADTICSGASYTWGMQTLTATGTYTQVFAAAVGCDSTVTLNLFERNSITHSFADTMCSGASYTWGTQTLTATGTYTQVFTAAIACDSTVTLNLFERNAIIHSFADTICFGASYTWGTQTLTATGTYTQVFTAAVGCDSTVTLSLFERNAITHSFADTICFGNSYMWGTQTLTATGSYSQVFTSATNCDSTVTLTLWVRPQISNSITATICTGTTYTLGTQTLNSSGVYTEVFAAANGCDSTVTLTLTVTPAVTNTVSITICNGAVYNWGSQVLNATGSYTQTFNATGGCDSIVTLNLTVAPAITNSITAAVCNGGSYTFGPQVLTASGSYSQVFPAANGCDSTVALTLTVKPAISNAVPATICFGASYTFGPQVLTTSGTYNQVFTAADGCDSTVTLTLAVSPAATGIVIDTAACGVVVFGGNTYFSNTVLQDTLDNALGCDSIFRTVNITVYNNTPAQLAIDTSGCGSVLFEGTTYTENTTLQRTYTSVHGCDSLERTVTIRIEQNQSDTTTLTLCAGQGYHFHGTYYSTTGAYKASYTGVHGCDSSFVLMLRVNPLPVASIDIPVGTGFCVGDSIELEARGPYDYRWADDYGIDLGEGERKKVLLPGYRSSFLAEATDGNGCRDTASVTITAQACCDVWLPNAFSPNGDGLNDLFKPEAKGHPKEYVMHIFDRWGASVFTSFKITEGWDGTVKGKPVDIATYYYRITGKCVNGEPLDRRGELTLIR